MWRRVLALSGAAARARARALTTEAGLPTAEQIRRLFPTALHELADCPVAAYLPVQVRGWAGRRAGGSGALRSTRAAVGGNGRLPGTVANGWPAAWLGRWALTF